MDVILEENRVGTKIVDRDIYLPQKSTTQMNVIQSFNATISVLKRKSNPMGEYVM